MNATLTPHHPLEFVCQYKYNDFRVQFQSIVTIYILFFIRYRKFTLKDGSGLVVRCKHDSVLPPTSHGQQPDQFIDIKALNEWDPKVHVHVCRIS